MKYRMVTGVRNDSIGESGFTVDGDIYVQGCFVNGYIQIVDCRVLFCFLCELQVLMDSVEIFEYCVYVGML